jgi:hypothetical protein
MCHLLDTLSVQMDAITVKELPLDGAFFFHKATIGEVTKPNMFVFCKGRSKPMMQLYKIRLC